MVFKHMFNHCLYKLLHFYGSTGHSAKASEQLPRTLVVVSVRISV